MCAIAMECERRSAEIEIRLEANEMAPREARKFVRRHLEKLGLPGLVDDATVVVSELVTNAITAAPDTTIFVALLPESGRVVLEVWDMAPQRPVVQSPDGLATSGRGLRVVQELSMTYGCNQKGRWKVVWALLGDESAQLR
jgi:anti-sigma regulatory factor (Ser/Thr protein kinase)